MYNAGKALWLFGPANGWRKACILLPMWQLLICVGQLACKGVPTHVLCIIKLPRVLSHDPDQVATTYAKALDLVASAGLYKILQVGKPPVALR